MNRIAILEGYTAPFGAYRRKRRKASTKRRGKRKSGQQSKMGKCARKCSKGRKSYKVCMRKCLKGPKVRRRSSVKRRRRC